MKRANHNQNEQDKLRQGLENMLKEIELIELNQFEYLPQAINLIKNTQPGNEVEQLFNSQETSVDLTRPK